MNYQLNIYNGFDSHAGINYIKLNKISLMEDVIKYCINHNCNGFVRCGKGIYYIRPPKYSATNLYNSRKLYINKSRKKDIVLYIIHY